MEMELGIIFLRQILQKNHDKIMEQKISSEDFEKNVDFYLDLIESYKRDVVNIDDKFIFMSLSLYNENKDLDDGK